MNRSALIAGGAKVVYAGATFYNGEPFEINPRHETFDIAPDALGKVDSRTKDIVISASIKPEGRFDAAMIAALWPYFSTLAGAIIPGDTDTPAVIHGADGEKHTIVCALVSKMPSIVFSTQRSLIDAVELSGILANAAAWSGASARYTVAGSSTFADAGWTGPALIKTQPYTLAFGAVTGLTAVDCEDGFTFEPTVTLEPITTDSLGIVAYRFVSVGVMVKCKPVTPTSANLLAAMKLQDSGVVRGKSTTANAAALTIVGADSVTYLSIPSATIIDWKTRFGARTLRNGEVAFVANRTFSAGSQVALCTLAAS